jgi:hypothetical protein
LIALGIKKQQLTLFVMRLSGGITRNLFERVLSRAK